MYNLLDDAIHLLSESASPYSREYRQIKMILEDTENPTTNQYVDKLFDSVIYKGHIDFGDIPNSRGKIESYAGYQNMMEVLDALTKLANANKTSSALNYIGIVKQAILNMKSLSSAYEKGFRMKNDYVMLEYNTWVYTIIQAVSALLYEYVDYIKRPDRDTFDIVMKNTKYRANSFYFDQLNKFNQMNKKLQYAKFLNGVVDKDKDNFVGAASAIGFGVVVSVALAAVPVMRELVYQYYNIKSNLSDCLAQQAYFLEMNKAVVESNSEFDKNKKRNILAKQEKVKNMCLRLSEKLRVNHIKAVDAGKASLKTDSKLLTLDTVKNEVNNAPLELF